MIQLKTTMMTSLSKYSPCLLLVAPVTTRKLPHFLWHARLTAASRGSTQHYKLLDEEPQK